MDVQDRLGERSLLGEFAEGVVVTEGALLEDDLVVADLDLVDGRLQELVDLSLLQPLDADDRYSLLEPIRQYAEALLAEDAAMAAIRAVQAEMPDARHHCYAWRLDDDEGVAADHRLLAVGVALQRLAVEQWDEAVGLQALYVHRNRRRIGHHGRGRPGSGPVPPHLRGLPR